MLSPGTMLGGRYRLDERIAGGGMGDVWRATDEVLGRTVAVKVLLAALLEEPGFAERFRGEARTMATINHPGVVDIYDYGNENGTAFLVMEYIEGDALSRTLSRVGRLTPARTMALVAQAADALHAAHEKGIVHRDVKPGNLLVRPNGTLVLTDFGIARSAAVGQLTAAGSVLGTASYISPEQAAGQGASPLSDVYALGVVAYQCLAGHRPFEGENPLEIAIRHVRDTPPPLPPDIPPPARQVVETAMAKDPAGRYPSAAAMAHVARHAAGQLATGGAGRPPAGMPGSPMAPASGAPYASPTVSAPVSGPPGAPVSGMPAGSVSGASGHPVSGPPGAPVSGPTGGVPRLDKSGGPVGAGGTRVMSGAAESGPVQPGGAPSAPGARPGGNPAGPGQFARGSAGVPPPPSRSSDTGYTYVGTGPMAAAGPPAARPGGAVAAGPPRGNQRNRNLALAGLLGALLLVLCIGGGVALVNNLGDDDPGASPPATTATPTTGAAAAVEKIDCDKMKGDPQAPVVEHLKKDGFTVKVTEVDDRSRKGTVVEVPCQAPKGSQVEVKVSNGKGRGAQPTTNPTTTAPTAPNAGTTSAPDDDASENADDEDPDDASPSCTGILGGLGCPPSASR